MKNLYCCVLIYLLIPVISYKTYSQEFLSATDLEFDKKTVIDQSHTDKLSTFLFLYQLSKDFPNSRNSGVCFGVEENGEKIKVHANINSSISSTGNVDFNSENIKNIANKILVFVSENSKNPKVRVIGYADSDTNEIKKYVPSGEIYQKISTVEMISKKIKEKNYEVIQNSQVPNPSSIQNNIILAASRSHAMGEIINELNQNIQNPVIVEYDFFPSLYLDNNQKWYETDIECPKRRSVVLEFEVETSSLLSKGDLNISPSFSMHDNQKVVESDYEVLSFAITELHRNNFEVSNVMSAMPKYCSGNIFTKYYLTNVVNTLNAIRSLKDSRANVIYSDSDYPSGNRDLAERTLNFYNSDLNLEKNLKEFIDVLKKMKEKSGSGFACFADNSNCKFVKDQLLPIFRDFDFRDTDLSDLHKSTSFTDCLKNSKFSLNPSNFQIIKKFSPLEVAKDEKTLFYLNFKKDEMPTYTSQNTQHHGYVCSQCSSGTHLNGDKVELNSRLRHYDGHNIADPTITEKRNRGESEFVEFATDYNKKLKDANTKKSAQSDFSFNSAIEKILNPPTLGELSYADFQYQVNQKRLNVFILKKSGCSKIMTNSPSLIEETDIHQIYSILQIPVDKFKLELDLVAGDCIATSIIMPSCHVEPGGIVNKAKVDLGDDVFKTKDYIGCAGTPDKTFEIRKKTDIYVGDILSVIDKCNSVNADISSILCGDNTIPKASYFDNICEENKENNLPNAISN